MRVFVRHCNYSPSSAHKKRDSWFSHEKCFKNLLEVFKGHSITVFFDGDPKDHFVSRTPGEFNLVPFDNGGTDAKSLKGLLEYIHSLQIPGDEIIYVCEDDYVHKPGAPEKIEEGLSVGSDYVTLYDHPDKYFPQYMQMYGQGLDFKTQLVLGKTCHWRTTPSTTSTYACRNSTMRADYDIHLKYLDRDHHRFLELLLLNKRCLVTPLPAWSTHCEYGYLSPFVEWGNI